MVIWTNPDIVALYDSFLTVIILNNDIHILNLIEDRPLSQLRTEIGIMGIPVLT
jgi:hypothetical protein